MNFRFEKYWNFLFIIVGVEVNRIRVYPRPIGNERSGCREHFFFVNAAFSPILVFALLVDFLNNAFTENNVRPVVLLILKITLITQSH